jgi:hypothetical protein
LTQQSKVKRFSSRFALAAVTSFAIAIAASITLVVILAAGRFR